MIHRTTVAAALTFAATLAKKIAPSREASHSPAGIFAKRWAA